MTTAFLIVPSLAATRQWFYWIAPVLMLACVAMIGGLVVGYYMKVLRPKYRGR
jgi:hypothetical protein